MDSLHPTNKNSTKKPRANFKQTCMVLPLFTAFLRKASIRMASSIRPLRLTPDGGLLPYLSTAYHYTQIEPQLTRAQVRGRSAGAPYPILCPLAIGTFVAHNLVARLARTVLSEFSPWPGKPGLEEVTVDLRSLGPSRTVDLCLVYEPFAPPCGHSFGEVASISNNPQCTLRCRRNHFIRIAAQGIRLPASHGFDGIRTVVQRFHGIHVKSKYAVLDELSDLVFSTVVFIDQSDCLNVVKFVGAA